MAHVDVRAAHEARAHALEHRLQQLAGVDVLDVVGRVYAERVRVHLRAKRLALVEAQRDDALADVDLEPGVDGDEEGDEELPEDRLEFLRARGALYAQPPQRAASSASACLPTNSAQTPCGAGSR